MIRSSCVCRKKSLFNEYILYKNETVFKDYEGTIIGICERCKLLKTFPSKKNKKFDPSITKIQDYESRKKEFKRLFEPLVKTVQSYAPKKGSVLDVGCSSGILLALLKSKGFNVFGIEPNKKAYLAAKRKLKKNIYHGTLRSRIVKYHKTYDCIIYNHVLEHIPDINKEFVLIRKMLKKGGTLIVGTPNTDNIIFKIRKKYWESLLPNEHVWHFNTKYLMQYLYENKYEVVFLRFEDDERKQYPLIKKIYFNILSLLNKIFFTGEAVLIIAKKKE
ncbi:hypothetical protein A2334_01460 [Candidatus Roizmanbacteria bacterium RIFOXYB2_FULL_38_10]|uniref:Methyltransferase type 11 domain-containing protein n=1 Tax=Candidatus Roizmanbacteria bacterium RIFOXYD1_FULL_38_12 TaxID=1802093 RepID=A0A1F7L277_9BACT|nr:MAG: hypothetical protein A3K47_05600 [Candidatus Roizmanbacteria bacterium RIFOXYA2_FULL_38_14]OGK64218.1 MAG: hypothetical protein A3K27_05600 [Candidatus Roizmanbacteria bacterium RIFOXYA1_FULL_37_12]OGK66064.1 MAG: hypothetical protein A3K38_05600 [Candidatus Roizmanbacteria bacterium RIFOXYB1_FULL_40_23]OGK68517.1 MAG: hypothetical protein A2334_01460 [Candidatus Roizmanbacteria bacterium RIFOXYB2_FULL_38_10]OGK70469.1 MAG: hypothetical protein A3K21_05605 [Candidatus Roizmanbacteria ba